MMALTNAERQQRFRQRRKLALRNTGNKTLAAAHAEWLREVAEIQGDISEDSIPGEVATVISHFISSAGGIVPDIGDESMSAGEKSVMGALGGVEYCQAITAWRHECREIEEYNKRRKEQNRKPYPTPPDIPVT